MFRYTPDSGLASVAPLLSEESGVSDDGAATDNETHDYEPSPLDPRVPVRPDGMPIFRERPGQKARGVICLNCHPDNDNNVRAIPHDPFTNPFERKVT